VRNLSLSLIIAASISAFTLPHAACAGDIPTFVVDPAWPKPLPNNWILGQVGGITGAPHRVRSSARFFKK
jgi:hypothetical protein